MILNSSRVLIPLIDTRSEKNETRNKKVLFQPALIKIFCSTPLQKTKNKKIDE